MPLSSEQISTLMPLLGNADRTAELEAWVHSTKELEMQLASDEYLDLISINFKESSARFFAEKIIRENISADEFLGWTISNMLERIIKRADDVHDDLREIYYLYSAGYSFLQKLALDFGLTIVAPSSGTNEWSELAVEDQVRLMDIMYPEIIKHAEQALDCLATGKIEFSGNTVASLLAPLPDQPVFIDRRSVREKKSMGIKVLNLDNPIIRAVWKFFRIPIYSYKID